MSFLKSGFRRRGLGSYALSMLSMLSLSGCVGFELARGSDTGSINDKITNQRTIKLDVLGGNGGKEVEIVEDGSVLGSGILDKNSGKATITVTLNNEDKIPSGETADKFGYDHELTLRYKDGGEISRLTVRLDDQKPETPDLDTALSSDTLLSETFRDSRAIKELVEYKVSNVEEGSTVRLYGASNTLLSELQNVSGSVQILRAKVTVGDSVTAKVIDKAGNESTASNAVSIRTVPASSLADGGRESTEGSSDWEGFDEKVSLSSEKEGVWELFTSLIFSGKVYFEREGAGEVLEVASSGAGNDIRVQLVEGRWSVSLEGDDQQYLIGVGDGYSSDIV